MKNSRPALAIDFDGALVKSRPFDNAHKRWFYLMSVLLDDPSIVRHAESENYFDAVYDVMKRYLGNVSQEIQTRFARNLFAMMTVAEARADDLVADFAEYLRGIKKKYLLAMVTTAPGPAVEPMLEKLGCSDIFDVIIKSPVGRHPDKGELMKEFIEKYGMPVFYIGDGDRGLEACRKLKIKTISVNWVSKAEFKGDFDVKNVAELEQIL